MSLHVRACLVDNLLKHLGRILLALIVTNHANLNLLLVTEIGVIVHLACDECVGLILHGLVE